MTRAERIGHLDRRLGEIRVSYHDAVAMASRLFQADPDEAVAIMREIESQHEGGATCVRLRRIDLLPGCLLEAEA